MLYDLLTGDILNLTRSGSRDRHPTWSPDSLWIAFTSDEPGNDDFLLSGWMEKGGET
jgi:Tol biopolymer transport system component